MIFYGLLALIVVWATHAIKRRFSQGTFRNIRGPSKQSWWSGNLQQLIDPDCWAFHDRVTQDYGGVVKIHGLFGHDHLLIFDPLALYYMLIREQSVYQEYNIFLQINRLLFGMGIISTRGEHHRKQRKLLNPAFSTSNIRAMFPAFRETILQLRRILESHVHDSHPVDIQAFMTRLSLELIGKSGLGYQFNSFDDSSLGDPYARSIKNLLPTVFSLSIFLLLTPVVCNIGTAEFRRTVINVIPWPALHEIRDMVDTMQATSVKILAAKTRDIPFADGFGEEQIKGRSDVMSILLRANNSASESERLPESEIVAQMSSLVFAAMDTTSGALSRLLFVLAEHPEAQCKLRVAIAEARQANGGELNFDDLASIPFLDAVCRETMRLYPPVNVVHRTAISDTVLPLMSPISDVNAKELTQIVVPKGTNLVVSILAANTNRAIWGEDATLWRPERWLQPLPQTVTESRIPGVYSHLMTFLGGPRGCIGFPFAQLAMKATLTLLLETLSFSLSNEQVVWKLHMVASPTVDGQLRLPLLVSRNIEQV
ncbi:cytochrome P450 [Suillus placidus]|uniref:Cytochrome P450 n=1 Tax=Suillus placidus TaxID=48579 RepID=A0A9P7A4C3_9AGAM|nr:cytochrome P450 [Suillus placidus]